VSNTNFHNGDRIIALAALGRGVTKGTKGVVTHVAFHHGLLTIRFDNGAQIQAVRLHQVAHA
jgi:hypothetical protein